MTTNHTHRVRSVVRLCAGVASLAGLVVGGCSAGRGPYSTPTEAARNTSEAERLTRAAADALERDPSNVANAEDLLRRALSADLYHGPAHNDLGVVYLAQGKLYEAAGEFEWARKLMPGHPDPRLNLAITLERAGRIDDATKAYESALEVYPDHMPATQALSRLQVRHGRTDELTSNRLRSIALAGTTQEWREWARHQLVRGRGE